MNYPPQPWNLSGNNWYVGFKLATPIGVISDIIALQGNASGIGGNALVSARGYLQNQGYQVSNTGILASNADLPAAGHGTVAPYGPLGYVPLPASGASVFNGLATGYNNGINLLGPYNNPPQPWDDYYIGFNAGLRSPGGYLGCNLSISYLSSGGQKTTQFWSQDISYYRIWNISEWSYPNTNIPNWFYTPPNYLPDWYYPSTLLSGGGLPIFATALSPPYGAIYQRVLPTAGQFIEPAFLLPPDQVQYNDFIANWPPTTQPYQNSWAFVGDVFQASPYLPWVFGYDPLEGGPLYAWSSQPLGVSSNGFCVPQPTPNPFLGMPVAFDPQDHPNEVGLPRSTWDGNIPQVNFEPVFINQDFLFNQGIGVGLGCTLYWLYVSQNLENYLF